MAPKNGNSSQTLLYFNLFTLVKLEGPPSYQLKECLKPGIFSKPNRLAFEQVMYFLINAYDPQLCRSVITCWPIVERRIQERIFRREIVLAFSKVASQEPDFGLPTFSQSFLSSSGGERLETFLCRLSALTLRTVLQRRDQRHVFNPPRGLNPRRCLTIAQSRTQPEVDNLLESINRCLSLMRICAEDSRSLSDSLVSNQHAIKTCRKTLTDLQISEITVEDMFSSEVEKEIQERLQALLQSLQVIKNQEKLIAKCEEFARAALDDQRSTAVLDCEEHLDIAVLLSRTADTVESISRRFGRPTSPEVYRKLLALSQDLFKISQLMEKNLKSVVELAATTSTISAEPVGGVTANPGTPERFRHACQLLEDASHSTPPLEFRPASFNPTWQTISADTESPPISSVADLWCAHKTNGQPNGHLGRRLLSRAPPQTSQNIPSKMLSRTPARSRSEIPVKIASKSSKLLVQKLNETTQNGAASTLHLPNAIPEILGTPVRSAKVSISTDSDDISSNGHINKEDSAQNVLNLVVSVLAPLSNGNSSFKSVPEFSPHSENVTVKEEIIIKSSPLDKRLVSLKFSESMNDSPVKKASPIESVISDKKPTERRKSILDLIERYRGIVPASESEHPVNVDEEEEPDEWKDSDVDISLDSDTELNIEEKHCVEFKFALSPGF